MIAANACNAPPLSCMAASVESIEWRAISALALRVCDELAVDPVEFTDERLPLDPPRKLYLDSQAPIPLPDALAGAASLGRCVRRAAPMSRDARAEGIGESLPTRVRCPYVAA
ncbi:hypothetical protein GGI00_005966 [Coemansia sp. RSA 2681]|nr:hypothetical protein GGI00_005966 [Coemansia sp. RSA 2681]